MVPQNNNMYGYSEIIPKAILPCDLSRHPGIGRGHPQRECSSIC